MNTMQYKYTDALIKNLNETFMNLNVPNKLDTGIDTSSMVNNMRQAGKDFIKRLAGSTPDPGEMRPTITSYASTPSTGHKLISTLFASVLPMPVTLPEIVRPSSAVKEAYNIPIANYVFLLEGMYKMYSGYHQSYGSNHKVYVEYKGGCLATPTKGGKFSNFLPSKALSSISSVYDYTRHLSSLLISKIHETALENFKSDIDRQTLNQLFQSNESLPPAVYDAIALGVIDTANINVQTTKGYQQTSKFLIPRVLSGKANSILDISTLPKNEYAVLTPDVLEDIATRLNYVNNLSNPYGQYTAAFANANELGRKNPVRGFATILKGCIQGANWIKNDIDNITGGGSKEYKVYFSNPTQEVIQETFGNIRYKDTLPFTVVKAFSDYRGFPLQIRCFSAEFDKASTFQYGTSTKANKVIAIPPGFNNFIVSKSSEYGGGLTGYLQALRSLYLTETSSVKGNVEGQEILHAAIQTVYKDSGKFNTGILFKFVPPILFQDELNGVTVLTSLDDLSEKSLAYTQEVDPIHFNNPKFETFTRTSTQAAFMLFHPVKNNDSTGIEELPRLMNPASGDGIRAQSSITNSFVPLKTIRETLLGQLDAVEDMNDLLRICNLFANVIKNLSKGFWSLDGDTHQAKLLTTPAGEKLLGFYNLLYSAKYEAANKSTPIGTTTGLLNISSITNKPDLFVSFRNAALEQAARGVTGNNEQ